MQACVLKEKARTLHTVNFLRVVCKNPYVSSVSYSRFIFQIKQGGSSLTHQTNVVAFWLGHKDFSNVIRRPSFIYMYIYIYKKPNLSLPIIIPAPMPLLPWAELSEEFGKQSGIALALLLPKRDKLVLYKTSFVFVTWKGRQQGKFTAFAKSDNSTTGLSAFQFSPYWSIYTVQANCVRMSIKCAFPLNAEAKSTLIPQSGV